MRDLQHEGQAREKIIHFHCIGEKAGSNTEGRHNLQLRGRLYPTSHLLYFEVQLKPEISPFQDGITLMTCVTYCQITECALGRDCTDGNVCLQKSGHCTGQRPSCWGCCFSHTKSPCQVDFNWMFYPAKWTNITEVSGISRALGTYR